MPLFILEVKMISKLTLEYLEQLIRSTEYLKLGAKTMVCFLKLHNGFEVVGSSACVSSTNFDQETGKKIAYENAIDKLWIVEGYKLQEKIYNEFNKEELQ